MLQRLELRGCAVVRGGKPILSDIAFSVEPGELVWLEGESGSGKTSLLMTLARLIPLSGGSMFLDGREVADYAPSQWRSRVCLLPHPPVCLDPTVRGDLQAPFQLRVRGGRMPPRDPDLLEELERLGLRDIGLDHPTRELSQGQTARLAFLRTLLAAPDVLLLDEPTANLDARSALCLAKRLSEFLADGAAAIVGAHAPPWSGVSQRFCIRAGRLAGCDP